VGRQARRRRLLVRPDDHRRHRQRRRHRHRRGRRLASSRPDRRVQNYALGIAVGLIVIAAGYLYLAIR